MNTFVACAVLLSYMPLSRCCTEEGQLLFCSSIPAAFPPGFSTLLLTLRHVGRLNATVLNSTHLSSVSRLRMEGAGVTGVADVAFSALQNLKNLSLNQNLLKGFRSSWFAQPNALVELDLFGNQIEALTPSMLSGFNALRRLNLSQNAITEIQMGSFSSLKVLSELDLSGNKMARLLPQVFSSLQLTGMRLDGNPWDCSCEAQQFVDFLKDLQNRSVLDRKEEVTCRSPPSFRGLPVWNVSVCVPAPVTQLHTTSRPNSVNTTLPHSSDVALTSSASSQTETSVSITTSDLTTHTLTALTGIIETCATLQLVLVSTSTICTVVAVLGVACLLWFIFWRKRSKKTVTPGSQSVSDSELATGDCTSSPAQQSDGEKEPWHSEVVWSTSTGVRTVKSAHAAFCTSPYGAVAVKELVTVLNETRTGVKNNVSKRKEEVWDGVETQVDNKCYIRDEPTLDSDDLHKGSESAGVPDDALPYLSIGVKRGDADEQAANGQSERATARKLMKRISTWPHDAVEWQARRKQVQDRQGRNVSGVWPPEVTIEAENAHSCWRPLEKMEGVTQREDERKMSDARPDVRHSRISKPPDEGASVSDALTGVMQQKEETHEGLARAGKMNSEATNTAVRGFPRAAKAEKSARRKEASAAGKRGVTPNDETLLSGNEYVFVDLLHEVVQNKGRWTRERWRQTHTCKPWRKERDADTHLK